MKNLSSCLFTILLVTISFFGCQKIKDSDVESGPEYSEQIKKIIEAKNFKIQNWYSEGLIDSVVSYFADDCIQLSPNQPPLIGNINFINVWKQNIQIGKWEFILTTEKVKASGNLATELGKYTLSFTPNENSPIPAITDKGNYVVLWEKINNDWKVVWDAPISELPINIQSTDL